MQSSSEALAFGTTSMSDHNSVLKPLSIEQQKQVATNLLYFFDPRNSHQIRSQLSLMALAHAEPFSLAQFFDWAAKHRGLPDYSRVRHHIVGVAKNLVRAGLLYHEGKARSGVLGDQDLFFASYELSRGASRGTLFLGKALGPSYIAHEIQRALVAISGLTADQDVTVGTGLHVHPEYIVTCDHVIRDMTVDRTLEVDGVWVSVVDCLKNVKPGIDVGVIRVKPPVPLALPDLLFRDANLLEDVLVAGFPTVPTSTTRFPTFQRGEISQIDVPTFWGTDVDLFSAIARPGNSGGPLVTLEGNVVGLVTQSLERERENADRTSVLPFFAAVPACDIRTEFEALTPIALPWETYE